MHVTSMFTYVGGHQCDDRCDDRCNDWCNIPCETSSLLVGAPDVSEVLTGNQAWHLGANTTFKVLPSRKEKMYFIFC